MEISPIIKSKSGATKIDVAMVAATKVLNPKIFSLKNIFVILFFAKKFSTQGEKTINPKVAKKDS